MHPRLLLISRWLRVRLIHSLLGGFVFFVPIAAGLSSCVSHPRGALADWFYPQSPFYDLSLSRVFVAAMACGWLVPNIRFSRTITVVLIVPLLGAVVGILSYALIEHEAASRAVATVYDPIEKQFQDDPSWKGRLSAAWLERPQSYQKGYPCIYMPNDIWCWAVGGGVLVGIPAAFAILATQQRQQLILICITIAGATIGETVLWNAVSHEFSNWERARSESIGRALGQ